MQPGLLHLTTVHILSLCTRKSESRDRGREGVGEREGGREREGGIEGGREEGGEHTHLSLEIINECSEMLD